MAHIMLDLETLGVTPGCAILSIGAVVFSIEGLGAEFSRVVSRKSCLKAGLWVEEGTLDWWQRQSTKAQEVLHMSDSIAAPDLRDVLAEFTEFAATAGGKGGPRVWGNGADFDNAILAVACHRANMPVPWAYIRSRCYRTLKACAPSIKAPFREGVHHNSLDDAKHQARHAIEIMRSFDTAARAEAVDQQRKLPI